MDSILNKVQRIVRESADEAAIIPSMLRVIADKYHIPAMMLWVPNRDGSLSMDAPSAVVTDPKVMDLVVAAASKSCALGSSEIPSRVAMTAEVVKDTVAGIPSVGFPVPFPGEGTGCLQILLARDSGDLTLAYKSVSGLALALGPIATLRDTRTALRRTSRRLHAITSDSETVALILRRDGVIADATGGQLLGDPQKLRGCNLEDFVVESDYLYLMGAVETQLPGEPRNLTFKVLRDSEVRTVDAVLRDMRDDADVNAYVLNLRDTTDQRDASRALVIDSRHDFLSGLLNQTAFSRAIDAVLRQHSAAGETPDVTLLIVDLNDFKKTNDHLGHIVADELLRAVAVRLSNALPHDTLTARIDGDSFGIAFSDDPIPVVDRIRQIMDLFDLEYPSDTGGVRLSATIGVASPVADAGPITAETLLWQADLARFHARRAGNPYAVFTLAMQDSVRRRRQLEADLLAAAENGSLHVNFQPLVGVANNSLVGVEALVRWQHPEFGLIPPAEFIPIAESSGSMAAITEYVLRQSLDAVVRMDAAFGNDAPNYVAVNISAPDLIHPDFVDTVREMLDERNLDGNRLALEITESVLMLDPDQAADCMIRLSDVGVKIDIDDFGTGYSSLTYLSRLPAHALKVDKAFVDKVLFDQKTAITVDAIIGLGHQLGLKVVVEGVESADQLRWFRDRHIDTAQGFFFSQPLDLQGLEAFIKKNEPVPDHV